MANPRESIRKWAYTNTRVHTQVLSRVLRRLFMSRVLACIPYRLFYFRRLPRAHPRAIECQGRHGGNYPVQAGRTRDSTIPFLSANRAMEHVSSHFRQSTAEMRRDYDLGTRYLNEIQIQRSAKSIR